MKKVQSKKISKCFWLNYFHILRIGNCFYFETLDFDTLNRQLVWQNETDSLTVYGQMKFKLSILLLTIGIMEWPNNLYLVVNPFLPKFLFIHWLYLLTNSLALKPFILLYKYFQIMQIQKSFCVLHKSI